MKTSVWVNALLLFMLTIAWYTIGQAGTEIVDSRYNRLLADSTNPQDLAAEFSPQEMRDLQGLNALRLRLKSQGQANLAENLFYALAKRDPTEAVLLNLSLTYIDQMQGKSLLQQGILSTRSQKVVEQIIKRDAEHWVAWYIKGINNLYWPDWFRMAPNARDYLTQASVVYQLQPPVERGENDMYALGYLGLGDAYALLDQPNEARRTWSEGLKFYPYVAALKERLNITEADMHAKVRAIWDANKPIDTDLAFMWSHCLQSFTVTLTGGTLFGPGPLDDQPLRPGALVNLHLGGALSGFIPPFNNGGSEPNLPGEILQKKLQGKTVNGLFSDGTKVNKNIDVGFVSLMNGKFNLFLAAVQDGPNAGKINFFLDDGWHWTIRDDIGIDPGFPAGIVKFWEFTFSTSPRVLPISRQTEIGAPAGVNRAGSVASGAVVPGALGDADFNGQLDGTLNAIGRFPFDSIILPGAPFAQTRTFDTNIPITPEQATLLTLANAISYLRLALDVQHEHPELAATLRETFSNRILTARRHAQHGLLPDSVQQIINSITNNSGETELCAMWKILQDTAPANGLQRRDFNASGIKMRCSK